MNEPRRADDPSVPSSRQLVKATAISALVAGAILVTTVLPAEYGVDPTGIGGLLGLTAMGNAKKKAGVLDEPAPRPMADRQLALVLGAPSTRTMSDARFGSPMAWPAQAATAERSDEVSVTLKPGDGAEVKAFMKVGDEMKYSWSTDGGRVNFDFHGEPPNAPSNVFTSYAKGTRDKAEGTFKAGFAGTHGWFWRNRTSQAITVTVKTSGGYEQLKRVK